MLTPKPKNTKTTLLLPSATWAQLAELSAATGHSYGSIIQQLAEAPQAPTMLERVSSKDMRRYGLTLSALARSLCERNAAEATMTRNEYITALVADGHAEFNVQQEQEATAQVEILTALAALKQQYGHAAMSAAIDTYINNC